VPRAGRGARIERPRIRAKCASRQSRVRLDRRPTDGVARCGRCSALAALAFESGCRERRSAPRCLKVDDARDLHAARPARRWLPPTREGTTGRPPVKSRCTVHRAGCTVRCAPSPTHRFSSQARRFRAAPRITLPRFCAPRSGGTPRSPCAWRGPKVRAPTGRIAAPRSPRFVGANLAPDQARPERR
jgi:hypothetical protein